MQEHIEQIARENISNQNKSGYAAVISVLLFCVFFAYSVENNFQSIPAIAGFILLPIIGVAISSHFSKKVIGKNNP